MRTTTYMTGVAVALALGSAHVASAAPALRKQVDQHGDFLLIGNAMGHECAAGTPAPTVGTIGTACSGQTNNERNDSAPDAFWNNGALIGSANGIANAKSTAVLTVPAGATVTHAYLYWAGKNTNGVGASVADASVNLSIKGGAAQSVDAIQSWVIDDPDAATRAYQSVADITALVQGGGTGAYEVSGIAANELYKVNDNARFGGWTMVVLYELATDPIRNLAVFDGLDVVTTGVGGNKTLELSGFMVPNAGFDGKLGIVAYEGDDQHTGDRLFFHPIPAVPADSQALTNGQNPIDNFFNSTRSWMGAAVTHVGDLPQLTGTAQSMGGLDLDVIDIKSRLTAGQTKAYVTATTTQDRYYPGVWITSISTYKPDFSKSDKMVTDLNGGTVRIGDELEYTIKVANKGNDDSIDTVLTDALPVGVTYVASSLTIDGAAKTDQANDDQGEYTSGTRTVTARLGTGATATQGGTMAIGSEATVTFRVTVDAGVSGPINNQALITAGGKQGDPPSDTPTDGNGADPGSPPTGVVVDECDDNSDCASPKAICNTAASPKVCVACVVDGDCGGVASGKVCDGSTNVCIDGCRGAGGNGCQVGLQCSSMDTTIGLCAECYKDGDCGGANSGSLCDTANNTCFAGCNNEPGNGCPGSLLCSSNDATIGVCDDCTSDTDCGDATSGKVCESAGHTCIDGCRGTNGNGCPVAEECSSKDDTIGQCGGGGTGGGGTGGGGTGGGGAGGANTGGAGGANTGGAGGANTGGAGGNGTGGAGAANTGGAGTGGAGAGNAGTGGAVTGKDGPGNGTVDPNDIAAEGGGILCSASTPQPGRSAGTWLTAVGGLALAVLRRRRRNG
jgi:uncharacterized repeat protein (TIGR01451 family)/MYXO-CTERM domain-containing protein